MDSSKDSCDASPLRNETSQTPISMLSRSIKQSRKVFIGTYLERRYVKCLQGYRDIVVVDQDEQELFKCLVEIQKVTEQQFGSDKWLGVTSDTKDSVVQTYSLWVELEKMPLGRHWFQLRSIKVHGNAVQVHLKYLRMFRANNERHSLDPVEYPSIDYREVLTYENACGTLRFVAVFVMSLLTVLCNALWYLGDYSLKLTHELSGLVRAFTPIAFGIIDFFTKCIGGLYWLLFVLWRGDSAPAFPPMKPPIQAYARRSKNVDRRSIGYNNY